MANEDGPHENDAGMTPSVEPLLDRLEEDAMALKEQNERRKNAKWALTNLAVGIGVLGSPSFMR